MSTGKPLPTLRRSAMSPSSGWKSTWDCLTYEAHTHRLYLTGSFYNDPPIPAILTWKTAECCTQHVGLFMIYAHAKFQPKAKYTPAVLLRLPFFWDITPRHWVNASDRPVPQCHIPHRFQHLENSHSSVTIYKKCLNKGCFSEHIHIRNMGPVLIMWAPNASLLWRSGQMMPTATLAEALLLVGSPMPDRSKVRTQTKGDALALQVGVGRGPEVTL